MAPRATKAKKSAETVASKKSKDKMKQVEEVAKEIDESEPVELEPIAEKKNSKRIKKAVVETSETEDTNSIDDMPPAKKGRKKKAETPTEENGFDDADKVSNKEPVPTGKGRKRGGKKELTEETKSTESTKASHEEIEEIENVVPMEKPKAARGRGRKAKVEEENGDAVSVTNGKGKKRGQNKAKEPIPELETNDLDEKESEQEVKKTETKGRKGKKLNSKDQSNEKQEEVIKPPKKRRGLKDDKKDEESVEEAEDEQEAPPKPVKGKRGQKKPAETLDEDVGESEGISEPTAKRPRKPVNEKVPSEDTKKKNPIKNKASTNYEELDFSSSSKTSQGKEWNFKIASWNVDGIRACMSKGGMDFLKYEKPDILCLQEVKCAQDKLPDEVSNVPGYHAYWLCSDKDGYAGVGIYTAKLAINVQYGLQNEELDSEGRIITAEYEQFYLICTYVPNAGRKLVTMPKRLQWNEEFRKHVKELDKKKPVIICGDMNVAHNEIDLTNPKTNKKNAGFTEEERSGMTDLLGEGFVDTFRHLYPDKAGAYTFWSYMMNSRAKNVGWRLDYFIVSERLLPALCDSVIREGVYGSDHCPISLYLHLSTAGKPKE